MGCSARRRHEEWSDFGCSRHLRRLAGLFVDDAAARNPAGLVAPGRLAPGQRIVLGGATRAELDAGRFGGDRDNDRICDRWTGTQVLNAALLEHTIGLGRRRRRLGPCRWPWTSGSSAGPWTGHGWRCRRGRRRRYGRLLPGRWWRL